MLPLLPSSMPNCSPCPTRRRRRAAIRVGLTAALLVLIGLTACTPPPLPFSSPVSTPTGPAIVRGADRSEAYWRIAQGNELRLAGRFAEAIPHYERAIALAPDEVEAYAGLGAALLGLGRAEEAIIPLQRAIALNPRHYWAHRLLGNAYLRLERYALAAEELTQAYVLNPDDLQVLAGLALAQGRSGQRELALRTLARLTTLTDDPELLNTAAVLRREFGGQ